jgi:type I restriction-modification system DNA methylase subunit
VPFLNGGLFDLEDDYDVREKVKIPNSAFAAVFDLLDRYNFTVTESTPLDIEVAVDPEMLGKVFEELVTGRHETGSYYTPRTIVAFMCREALKHYLVAQAVSLCYKAGDDAAVAHFVDDNDPSAIPDPEAVLEALKRVKVCDPACGSGAYLLGMMHELLRLRQALFATRGLDSSTIYQRKLEIIQNNLYGVDMDLFAVNIAKLRLWLSLAVDYEGPKPPPLPNLDFKIERGDSLTAPDPQEIPDLFRKQLVERADQLADLKGQYLSTYEAPKKKLAERIYAAEAELRATLQHSETAGSVDWRVAFAEVFKNGGFDIALENPPYVRQELFKEAKATLRRNFPQVYESTADLYVYFYARTHQILRPGGTACVISSNKWLKAGYGEPLRRFFANSAWVESVVDFGHAKQIFQDADVFPSILVFRKPTADAPPPTARVCAIPRE